MNEDHELDSAALTRLVQRFRRLARLAAVDPLRALPRDPLEPLALLSEPVDALVAAEPLERLRQATDAPVPEAHPAVARSTGLPLVPRVVPTTTAAALTSRTTPTAAAHDRLAATGPRRVSMPPALGTRSEGTPMRTAAPASAATIAERRRALRLGARSVSPAAPASAAMSTVPHASPTNVRTSPLPPRGAAAMPPAAARTAHATSTAARVAARRASARRVDREARPDLARISPSSILDAVRAAAPAPTSRPTIAVASDTPVRAYASDATAAAALEQLEQAGSAPSSLARSPAAHALSTAAVLPPTLADPVAWTSRAAAPRSRAGDPRAGLDLADDLFETLYREGVDLSWP